jgi:hypothetical protein
LVVDRRVETVYVETRRARKRALAIASPASRQRRRCSTPWAAVVRRIEVPFGISFAMVTARVV